MESWYHDNLHGDERVAVSDSGYTNSELAMEYLRHFIQHTPSAKTKLLIMDSHISHEVPEFIILAHQNNIHLHVFPLTLRIFYNLLMLQFLQNINIGTSVQVNKQSGILILTIMLSHFSETYLQSASKHLQRATV